MRVLVPSLPAEFIEFCPWTLVFSVILGLVCGTTPDRLTFASNDYSSHLKCKIVSQSSPNLLSEKYLIGGYSLPLCNICWLKMAISTKEHKS